jgi:hypothetical protein
MGPEDTPAEVFKECIFDSIVENAQTTSKTLDATLDLRTKVSRTILKKFTSNATPEGMSLPFTEAAIIRHGEWCCKGLIFSHGMTCFNVESAQWDAMVTGPFWSVSILSGYREYSGLRIEPWTQCAQKAL